MENLCDSAAQKDAVMDCEIMNVWVKIAMNDKYCI